MRAFLVGLFLLINCGPAFGQAQGFVEKIGFGKSYRPYGWTPLLVNLTSTIGEPDEYEIQVRQEDLDRDRVIFRRKIVLNPNKQEQFWIYFLAQPRGFDDATPASLNKYLDVRLCTKSGKPLTQLKIQDQLQTLDPPRQPFGAQRGYKLVLMVSDGSGPGSFPAVRDFNGAIGTNEEVATVLITPFDLPESVIGFDAVDTIVWLDADSNNLTTGGSRRLAALTEFVRSGGRLVVCQTPEQFKLDNFADILPVESKNAAGDSVIEIRDKADAQPIRKLAEFRTTDLTLAADGLREAQQAGWDRVEKRGPFKVAFAKLRPDAVGEHWIDWKGDGSERSPWIARRPFGMGSVTWVAQDLGNRGLTGRDAMGWAYVWDAVLGQRNFNMRTGEEIEGNAKYVEASKLKFSTNAAVDLGSSLLRGMDHEGRAGGLMFLAGVFFIGYWVVAGPVSYLVLAGKKKTHLSWTIFGVSALGATLLTVGVVRLVLRGDAALHHVSLVRMMPDGRDDDGTPRSRAIIDSRIGLYIPRDYSSPGKGAPVSLLENDKDALSYITPFSVHPAHMGGTTDYPAYLEYDVPVRDAPLTELVEVLVPYRSTLKKLQARWVGRVTGGVEVYTGITGGYEAAKPKLVPIDHMVDVVVDKATNKVEARKRNYINGVLVNRTGVDLAHVYFVFNFPALYEGGSEEDWVLYVPQWAKGDTLNLGEKMEISAALPSTGTSATDRNATPGEGNKKPIRGKLSDRVRQGSGEWGTFWYSGLRAGSMSDQFDDSKSEYIRSFPMLSLFDRIKPLENEGTSIQRVEVMRRAAREFDVSELVAAGQLVVLATAGQPGKLDQSPLPFPMDVEGDRITGTGTTFYQFALPLDRTSALPAPWTKDENAGK